MKQVKITVPLGFLILATALIVILSLLLASYINPSTPLDSSVMLESKFEILSPSQNDVPVEGEEFSIKWSSSSENIVYLTFLICTEEDGCNSIFGNHNTEVEASTQAFTWRVDVSAFPYVPGRKFEMHFFGYSSRRPIKAQDGSIVYSYVDFFVAKSEEFNIERK